MKLGWIVVSFAGFVVLAAGCGQRDRSEVGFRLPAGDAASGKTAFVELGCVRCHTVYGEADLPAPVEPTQMELGGKLRVVRTYGQLVTSIIHPGHSISSNAPKSVKDAGISPMTSFNDTMTVRQMIDLVAFLHSKYKRLEPGYNPVPF